MSGIAGIIHFDSQPVEPGQVEAMTAFMAFRGPDGIHHWRRGHVALGQCMLHTTPESLEEHQPLANDDQSVVLVMDGRLDNWEELRELLLRRGANLRTRSDAELVLRSYETWGDDCLREIDGDFAFVIWDARQRKALCARDRFGNKPFHYSWDGTTLSVSTDLRPLLDLPWVPKEPDLDTVAEYLAADWMTLDTTLWTGVKRLRAAHAMRIGPQGRLEIFRYWQPNLAAKLPCKTDQDYIEHYRALFFDTVRRTCRSHKPLALEVSGGLDSSAIYAAAVTLLRQGRLPAPDVDGYTLDFGGVAEADELEYAEAVGSHLGTVIRRVDPAHMPLARYSELARQFADFPDYPNGAMGLGIAKEAQARGCRTLISGTGGDEWTGGSFSYMAEALTEADWHALRRLLAWDVRHLGPAGALSFLMRRGLIQCLPPSVLRRLRQARDSFRANPGQEAPFWLSGDMELRHRMRKTALPSDALMPIRRGQARQIELLEQPYWQSAKGMNDRRTAQLGLEWRQPFWTRHLVEASFATPDALHNRGGQTRWLHRNALRGVLPEAVLRRTNKAGFDVTFQKHWVELRLALAGQPLKISEAWVSMSAILQLMDRSFTSAQVGWDVGPPWIVYFVQAALEAQLPLDWGASSANRSDRGTYN